MKKQYLVMVQHRYQVSENKWSNVRWFEDGHRYFQTKKEAQVALKRYISKHNEAKEYGPDGKRRETHEIGGGFGADIVIDKKLDDENRVVAWKIKVRQVTEWEDVDSKTLQEG